MLIALFASFHCLALQRHHVYEQSSSHRSWILEVGNTVTLQQNLTDMQALSTANSCERNLGEANYPVAEVKLIAWAGPFIDPCVFSSQIISRQLT